MRCSCAALAYACRKTTATAGTPIWASWRASARAPGSSSGLSTEPSTSSRSSTSNTRSGVIGRVGLDQP